CANTDVSQIPNCGSPSDPCGTCPACTANCNGRACGADPMCPQSSCGTCPNGLTCNSGQCGLALLSSLEVPDGAGGRREVQPLARPTTQPVGAVDGAFSVSDRGTAVYTVPLVLPPGRAGFQPNIKVEYDSSKTNGPMGIGWSVGGLSSIARCPPAVAKTG